MASRSLDLRGLTGIALLCSALSGLGMVYGAHANLPQLLVWGLVASWGIPWLVASLRLLPHFAAYLEVHRAWTDEAERTPGLSPPPSSPVRGLLRAWFRISIIWGMVGVQMWLLPSLAEDRSIQGVLVTAFVAAVILHSAFTFLHLSTLRHFCSPGREYDEGLMAYLQYQMESFEVKAQVERLLSEVDGAVEDGEVWKWG